MFQDQFFQRIIPCGSVVESIVSIIFNIYLLWFYYSELDLLPHDAHGSTVNESETVLVESDTVLIESGTVLAESDTDETIEIVSDTGKTNESNVDVIIESDHEEINENVNTETRRPKTRGRWRRRVRSLLKVFTCCVKQPNQ